MPAHIKVVGMYEKIIDGEFAVNTTSKAMDDWQKDLSPFHLGPCDMYQDFNSKNMENAWQFSKLYSIHADVNGDPTDEYWDWAKKGWNDSWAHRYPMGKGAKPLCSYWNGEKLGYISARKKIYAPLYAKAVQKTDGWKKLQELYDTKELIVLRDYDGYDHGLKGMTLTEVLNNPKKKMGHAFVLAMLLLNDNALKETDIV
jgi:hypothetical protein